MASTATTPRASKATTGSRSLRRDPEFFKLWSGEAVSQVGGQVTLLALPLTAALLLEATPSQMGLLGAAQTAPFLLLALPAGVWVDRTRRRPVLIAANLGRAVLLGLIPMLALLGALRMWHLYGIAFLVGAFTVCFDLAFFSYLPGLVGRGRLVDANAKLQGSASVAEIGGPGLAGLLAGVFSAPLAIALDAASFGAAAWALSRIRTPEHPVPPKDRGGSLRREIAEGVRGTFGNRYLLAFAGEAATYNVFWHAINAVLVLYAVRALGLGAGALGAFFSVGAVGALLGALLTSRWARRFGIGPTMIGSAIVSNVGTLLIPLATGPGTAALALLGVGFFLRGVGMTGCNVQVYAVRQAVVPDRLLGRVNGTYQLLTHGFIPLGALLGGFLGESIGLRPALLVCASALFWSWLWLFLSPARSLRELPADGSLPPVGDGAPVALARTSGG